LENKVFNIVDARCNHVVHTVSIWDVTPYSPVRPHVIATHKTPKWWGVIVRLKHMTKLQWP